MIGSAMHAVVHVSRVDDWFTACVQIQAVSWHFIVHVVIKIYSCRAVASAAFK